MEDREGRQKSCRWMDGWTDMQIWLCQGDVAPGVVIMMKLEGIYPLVSYRRGVNSWRKVEMEGN